jgi:hypothetical protein
MNADERGSSSNENQEGKRVFIPGIFDIHIGVYLRLSASLFWLLR